ncbi:MAG: gas vesicle protein [Actinomycetota bacterium]|nr:gas vesicle protein [Actinomycetota bacterium]
MSDDSSNGNGHKRLAPGEAIASARDVIQELTGKRPEGVSAVNKSDDGGWTVAVDIVELSRVPASTDVLATYEVTLDGEGTLVDMERTRRYTRNQTSEE